MQKKGRAGTSRAGKIALYGMMTALAFLLSYVETLIPLNLGVPGDVYKRQGVAGEGL